MANIDGKLEKLANFLALPDGFVRDADLAADEIFKLLSAQSSCSISRCRIVGGFGKKTSTAVKADLDAVVFVNLPAEQKTDQKWQSILDEWKNILAKHCTAAEFNLTNRTLKVEYKQISLDLLPAVNLAKDSSNVEKSQFQETLAFIKRSVNPSLTAMNMSAELSETSLMFLKGKTKYAHDIARLAKFWNQGLLFPGYIAGRSVIMETLAVQAADQAANNSTNPSHQAGFIRFLNLVAAIEISKYSSGVSYSAQEVPAQIMRQQPLLLDPSNPYNNLLDIDPMKKHYYGGTTPSQEFFKFLADCAKSTLSKLTADCPMVSMNRLFYPRPLFHTIQDKLRISVVSWNVSSQPKTTEMPRCVLKKQTNYPKLLEAIGWGIGVFLKSHEYDCINGSGDAGPVEGSLWDAATFDMMDVFFKAKKREESSWDAVLLMPMKSTEKMLKISFNFKNL